MNDVTSPHTPLVESQVEDERWELVRRIAGSRHLAKAPQLREILLYISQRALVEHAAVISEQEIGCKVLGRRPDFSPNEDNIVRVQIRHLRKKLEEYFQTDGTVETYILTIPKGGYVPRFEPRVEYMEPDAAAVPDMTRVSPLPPARGLPWAVLVPSLLLLGVLAAAILWNRPRVVRPAAEDATPAQDPLWSKVFAPHRETRIVVADTNLVMVQDILHADIPLSEYLKGGYPDKLIDNVPDRELQGALRLISHRQYTSLGDATLAARFIDLGRRFGAQPNLLYSRYVSVRDFKAGNFILIGSRRGIVWEQLFESQLNFNIEEDRVTRQYHLRNKSPLPGERPVYGLSDTGRTDQETYADIAFLPNLAGTGYVLILSGIDMVATEAAGELVTSPDFGATVTKMLGLPAGSPPSPYFEILLEAKATGGTSEGAKIIAFRRFEAPRS